jgi:hypothetical protein
MTLNDRMNMSHVQFAPEVSDETLEEYLETKTVVVSL